MITVGTVLRFNTKNIITVGTVLRFNAKNIITVGTVLRFNTQIVDRSKVDIPSTQIHDLSLS